jgi:hypothetical protein
MAQEKQGLNVYEVIGLVFEVVEKLCIQMVDERPCSNSGGRMVPPLLFCVSPGEPFCAWKNPLLSKAREERTVNLMSNCGAKQTEKTKGSSYTASYKQDRLQQQKTEAVLTGLLHVVVAS